MDQMKNKKMAQRMFEQKRMDKQRVLTSRHSRFGAMFRAQIRNQKKLFSNLKKMKEDLFVDQAGIRNKIYRAKKPSNFSKLDEDKEFKLTLSI